MIWLWFALTAFVAAGSGGFIVAGLLALAVDDRDGPANPASLLVGVGVGTLIGVALAVRFAMWLRGWN